jgi:hypothetical protein
MRIGPDGDIGSIADVLISYVFASYFPRQRPTISRLPLPSSYAGL